MIFRLLTSIGIVFLASAGSLATEIAKPKAAATIDLEHLPTSFPLSAAEYLQGIALPKLDAQLTPGVEGTVAKIHVREGQQVTAGSPLLTIDDRVAQAAVVVAERVASATAAVRRAELAMLQAQSILTRTEIALRSNASSEFEFASKQNEFDQAQAVYRLELESQAQAEAEVQLAKARLSQHTIRAPFDGEVLELRAKIGDTVKVDDFAVRMANLDLLQANMHLPVGLYGQLSVGQRISLRAVTPVKQTVPCVVRYVSPIIEPTSGTFRVSFEIANHMRGLPAGLELWFSPDSIEPSPDIHRSVGRKE